MDQEKSTAGKVPKACEPCRHRKVRCNGAQPCAHRDCQKDPQGCVYRQKARVRKSLIRSATTVTTTPTPEPAPGPGLGPGPALLPVSSNPASLPLHLARTPAAEPDTSTTQPEVYHSVTETHPFPKATDSSQLFYGPSSNFAFLQQVHRGILSNAGDGHPSRRETRSGLDTFMQRSNFFGTTSRIDIEAVRTSGIRLPSVTLSQARLFLDMFKANSYYRHPFYTSSELDDLLHTLYSPGDANRIPPQTKALFLAILALGALGTVHTELAEALCTQAKREAIVFDDVVTLQMLQFSILMADYQINMGRPNSTYLHLGVACRKAFALGLHKEGPSSRLSENSLRKHRTTLWLLYFYETCQALTMGRTSSMKLSDISCPPPTEPGVIVSLFQIAKIMEAANETIYSKKAESLRQLYLTAEKLHGQLRQFAESHGIGSTNVDRLKDTADAVEALVLHTCYYLAVVLIFRPFLVASCAMRSDTRVHENSEMWLRQACRYAVDAAQDSIVFTSNVLRKVEVCRNNRYQSFFLESKCAVLLYDILCQPAKYTYNIEYIHTALNTLSTMVADEPVTTAENSIRRILKAVEKTVASQMPPGTMENGVRTPGSGYSPATVASGQSPGDQGHHSSIQFPSLEHYAPPPGTGEQMIFLSERNYQQPMYAPHAPMVSTTAMEHEMPLIDPSAYFNLDVMTTDLFNFFPMDVTTPMDFTARPNDGP